MDLRYSDWPGWLYAICSLTLFQPGLAFAINIANNNGPDTATGWYAISAVLFLSLNAVNAAAVTLMRIVQGDWPWQ